MAKRNGRGQSPRVPKQGLVVRLYEEIARLHATIQSLRTSLADMEDDRQRLLAENRKIRRQLTRSVLVDAVISAAEKKADEGNGIEKIEPARVELLYQRLPHRISIPAFFQVAQHELGGAMTAGRCLVHYLRENLFDWTGAYLEKPKAVGRNGEEKNREDSH